MNRAQREKLIIKAVGVVAATTGKEIDEWGMAIYIDELARFEAAQFERVVARLRAAFKERVLPSVKELEDAAVQRATGKNDVDEAVARICAGVRLFGYTNIEKAREHAGELGWEIVLRYGGWQAVCGVETEKDLAVMRAQMKQTGESVRERSSLGILSEAPRLPLPEESRGLKPANAILGNVLNGIGNTSR